MAVPPISLRLENLESRLNLSTVAGGAFVSIPGRHSFVQDRATLKGAARLIPLAGAAKTKALVAQALVASAQAESPAPDIMVSATQKTITISWQNNSINETGFHIERSTNGKNFTLIANVDAGKTSYTDTKAVLGTTYTYRVTAYNKSPSTAVSHAISAALQAPPAPATPTQLSAGKITTTSITLSWHDNASNESGYRVYRSSDDVHFALIASLKPGAQSLTDIKLSAGATYFYKVSAWNAGGETFIASALKTATLAAPPAAPTSVSLSNITGDSINVNWSESSQNVEGFRIYRSANGGAYTLIGNAPVNAKTFTDTTVAATTKYSYEVSAWNSTADVKSRPVTGTTLTAPPGAPTNLAFSDITTSGVTLSWTDNATNEAGFHVYRSTDGTNYTLATTLAANSTTFSDQNLNPGTMYWYKVTAFSRSGEISLNGQPVTTLTPSNQAASLVLAPDAPANVTFSNITLASVTLNWTESSTDVSGIRIYRSTDGTNYTFVADVAAGATSWSDTGLQTDTTYDYKVAAWNDSAEARSLPAVASTLAAVPNTPTGLGFSSVTSSSVTLHWADSGNITGYHIYRSTNGAAYTQVGDITASTTGWTDTGLAPETSYQYVVGAYTSGGEAQTSGASVSTLVAAPNAPAGISFTSVTTSGITLNWSTPGNQTGYHIYRSTDGANFTSVGTLAANAVSWSDAGLASGTTYYYSVGAFNAGGEMRSAGAAVTTTAIAPNAPTGVNATTITSTGLTLNWTAPGTQAGYRIYRSTDGTNFTLIGTATAGTTSWSDSTLSASTTYYYSVAAYNTGGETRSIAINATTAAAPVVAPVTMYTQNMTSFTELVVVGTTTNDSIVVSQSNGILNIVANGQTYTQTNTFGDLKIYANGGNDNITVNSSVNIATLIYGGDGNDTIQNLTTGKATIVTIGNGTNTVTGNGVNTSYWVNTGDTVHASAAEIALGGVNRVSNFYQPFSTDPANANYIPRTLNGQNLTDPSDSGAEKRLTSSSFWGTGPSMNDINQTGLADCYYLAPLASLAYSEPQKLMNMGVDLGDGTYAVRFVRGGVTSYVRVDGDLPTGYWNYGLANQTPGADGNQWGSIFEKAYAYFRTGASTYSSLNWGSQASTYWDLGLANSSIYPSLSSGTTVLSTINTQLAAGHGMAASTIVTPTANAPLIGSHVYTVIGAFKNSSGTVMIQLRNPWGVDGAGNDANPNDGLVTIDFATFAANFTSLNYTLA